MTPIDPTLQALSKIIDLLKPFLNSAEQKTCSLLATQLLAPMPSRSSETRFARTVELVTAPQAAEEGGDPNQESRRNALESPQVKKEADKLSLRGVVISSSAERAAGSHPASLKNARVEEAQAKAPPSPHGEAMARKASLSLPPELAEKVKTILREAPSAIEWLKTMAKSGNAPLAMEALLNAVEEKAPSAVRQEGRERLNRSQAIATPLNRLAAPPGVQKESRSPKVQGDAEAVPFKAQGGGERGVSLRQKCAEASALPLSLKGSMAEQGGKPPLPQAASSPFALPFFYSMIASFSRSFRRKKKPRKQKDPREDEDSCST